MKYAISAVPGHEAETAGASPVSHDGFPSLHDTELDLPLKVAFVGEYPTHEAAHHAALEFYGEAE